MQTPSRPTTGGALRPRARTTDLVVSQLPDEELIYDLKTHQAYCLNKTAAAVWDCCDGETTVPAMAQALAHELGLEVSEEWVWLALRQLHRSALLEPGILWPETISRRAVLRKLGASALAIPMVLAIVVPAAAQAASCGDRDNDANQNAIGCPCQSNNDCANNCCGFGNICAATGSVPNGSPCRVNCECATGLTCKGSPQRCLP